MKKTLSLLMIFVFPVILSAQSHGWEVDLGIAGALSDATLVSTAGDSLYLEVMERTKAIELSWVKKLERRDDPSRIPKVIVGGTIIGGLVGFVIGSLQDHGTDGESSGKKYSYGSLVGLLGGALGTVIAFSSGITKHDLTGMSIGQKCALLDSIIQYDNEKQFPVIDYSDSGQADAQQMDAIQQSSDKPARQIIFSAGPSFPIGDFGEPWDGAAKIGEAITLELSIGRAPSWISSITLSFNGFNESQMRADDYLISHGSWWTVWPMTGLRTSNNLSPNVAAFFHGEVGFVIGKSPKFTIGDINDGVSTISSDLSGGIAVGFGGGLAIRDRFFVGGRFLYAKPEYTISRTGPRGTYSHNVEQSTSLLLFTLGIGL